MSACERTRELLGQLLEGALSDEQRQAVDQHLAGCAECREMREALELIRAVLPSLGELEPPPELANDLAASPCRRWLGLLHQAVDHEIDHRHLEQLLSHLGGCAACRQAWNDLTLIRQVSDVLDPAVWMWPFDHPRDGHAGSARPVRPDRAGRLPRGGSSVVVSGLDDDEGVALDGAHEPVLLVDPARPVAR